MKEHLCYHCGVEVKDFKGINLGFLAESLLVLARLKTGGTDSLAMSEGKVHLPVHVKLMN